MLKCYAIKDEKIGIFQSPFFVQSVVEAIRSLTSAVQNPQSNLFQFSEDFSLHHIGDMDDNTGVLIPNKSGPELITKISALKKTQK